jgi:hypothetical protein
LIQSKVMINERAFGAAESHRYEGSKGQEEILLATGTGKCTQARPAQSAFTQVLSPSVV